MLGIQNDHLTTDYTDQEAQKLKDLRKQTLALNQRLNKVMPNNVVKQQARANTVLGSYDDNMNPAEGTILLGKKKQRNQNRDFDFEVSLQKEI